MIRFDMKHYNVTLIEKHQKYQNYHLVKNDKHYIRGKEILRFDQRSV